MATRIDGMLAVASVVRLSNRPGGTGRRLQEILGVIPLPEGRFGPPRLFIFEAAQSHSENWAVVITGILNEINDPEPCKAWWLEVLRTINDPAAENMGLVGGSVTIRSDSHAMLTINWLGEIEEGMEAVGDE